MHLVGPCISAQDQQALTQLSLSTPLDSSASSANTNARSAYTKDQLLSQEDLEWFNQGHTDDNIIINNNNNNNNNGDNSATNNDDDAVVFISMGTLARLNFNQTRSILIGALASGMDLSTTQAASKKQHKKSKGLRLLWKADKQQQETITSILSNPDTYTEALTLIKSRSNNSNNNVADIEAQFRGLSARAGDLTSFPGGLTSRALRAVPWVSSQLGVLSHRNTHIFISHCGINSASETALAAGGRVQLLCIPMFGDQLDMAQRVRDAGLGLYLHKHTAVAPHYAAAFSALVAAAQDPVTRARGAAVQRAMQLAGGTPRAVDLVQFAAYSHLDARYDSCHHKTTQKRQFEMIDC